MINWDCGLIIQQEGGGGIVRDILSLPTLWDPG